MDPGYDRSSTEVVPRHSWIDLEIESYSILSKLKVWGSDYHRFPGYLLSNKSNHGVRRGEALSDKTCVLETLSLPLDANS